MAARLIRLLVALLAAAQAAFAGAFDASHAAWDALLKEHVVPISGGRAGQLDYAGMARDRAALRAYLASLSALGEAQFDRWPRAERMAFLINAYNAFMVEKVLTRYPELHSVWDFGRIFGNPFKDEFFTLFGRPCALDAIEHGRLRRPGAYDDPRVHFALNCASVGCPMLREEAYVGERLDAQLEDQTERFLSDRTRNRYERGRLEVSKVFDWYRQDWERGFRGARSPAQFLARYAPLLADDSAARRRIAAGAAPIVFLDYDWSLNDLRR